MTDNELYHYGVKGMKWGVRRYEKSGGSLEPTTDTHQISKKETTSWRYQTQLYQNTTASFVTP